MSTQEIARLNRQNSVLVGLVSGITGSLGLALVISGLVGIGLDEGAVGFLGICGGATFIGLAAFIARP